MTRGIYFLYFGCAFLFSLVFLDIYVEDDQSLYIKYYDSLIGLSIDEAYDSYKVILGAREPIYFLLTYFLNDIIAKSVLVSLMNGVLLCQVLSFLYRNKKVWLVPFVFTNFYTYALFFSHERLKLGLIIFIFFLKSGINNQIVKYLMPVLGHFQFAILSIPLYFNRICANILKSKSLFSLCMLLLALLALYEPVLSKLSFYYEALSLTDVLIGFVKVILFGFFAALFSKNSRVITTLCAALLTAVLIVGGDRVVIFAYGLMMYSYIVNNNSVARKYTILVILINIYFSIKGLHFMYNVIDHGHGF